MNGEAGHAAQPCVLLAKDYVEEDDDDWDDIL